jgi:hypothetical protein
MQKSCEVNLLRLAHACLDSKENYKLLPDVMQYIAKVSLTLNESLIGVKIITRRTSKARVPSFSRQTKLLMSTLAAISMNYVASFWHLRTFYDGFGVPGYR